MRIVLVSDRRSFALKGTDQQPVSLEERGPSMPRSSYIKSEKMILPPYLLPKLTLYQFLSVFYSSYIVDILIFKLYDLVHNLILVYPQYFRGNTMLARFRLGWHKAKQYRLTVIAAIIVLLIIVAFVFAGYRFHWSWTGFLHKTLWDWLQLLVIPAVLAVGGYLFSFTMNKNEQKAADRRNQTEREVAQDNQREAALQEYIDKMSELLLHEKLRESQSEDEVRKIARVRTLTVLTRLDRRRKGSVLQFLHESGLIEKGDKRILSLHRADLRGADLRKASLSGADLREALLIEADLWQAHLEQTDLKGANLSKAALDETDLTMANLSHAVLAEASLMNANFDMTELVGANFEKADLEDAKFIHTSNFTEANLHEAKIWQEDLTGGGLHLERATMPDGSKHP